VYVGRYYGQHEIDITPELVQHYCQSVGDHNPWYVGDSPFGGPVAAALLLHSEVYRYGGWYLPNVYGNLHAKQEWELFQPMMVGERALTRATIVDRYIKRDREYVVNEVSCFGSDGRLLNRGRTQAQNCLSQNALGPRRHVVVDAGRPPVWNRRKPDHSNPVRGKVFLPSGLPPGIGRSLF